jgi:hypothetical protein
MYPHDHLCDFTCEGPKGIDALALQQEIQPETCSHIKTTCPDYREHDYVFDNTPTSIYMDTHEHVPMLIFVHCITTKNSRTSLTHISMHSWKCLHLDLHWINPIYLSTLSAPSVPSVPSAASESAAPSASAAPQCGRGELPASPPCLGLGALWTLCIGCKPRHRLCDLDEKNHESLY